MKDLIGNLQPRTVVEIGCFTGVSTVWMAAGLEQNGKEAALHSLDLFPDIRPDHHLPYRYLDDSLGYATEHVARAGLSHRVRFHKLNSVEVAKDISKVIPPPYDFVFIDGDHSFGGCLSDVTSFLPHVSVGGYIVLHDIYPSSDLTGPRDVLECYIRRSANLDVVEIDTSPDNFGLALIRKRSALPGWSLRQRWSVFFRMVSNLLVAGWRRIGRKMGWVGEWKYGQLSISECLRDLKLMLRSWRP